MSLGVETSSSGASPLCPCASSEGCVSGSGGAERSLIVPLIKFSHFSSNKWHLGRFRTPREKRQEDTGRVTPVGFFFFFLKWHKKFGEEERAAPPPPSLVKTFSQLLVK